MKTYKSHLSASLLPQWSKSKLLCSYQEELPANILKCHCSSLKIDEIREGNGCNRECNALGAKVVGEDFAIEDYAGHIDSTAIEKEEDIAILTSQILSFRQKSLTSEP